MKSSEKKVLVDCLLRADRRKFSCGCPYLALADELGYITMYAATHSPDIGLSNFGRLSVRKMLKTYGLSTDYAQFIYEELENGKTLHQIAEEIHGGILYDIEPYADDNLKREFENEISKITV